MKYIVACSGGNDSVALIQFMQTNYKGNYSVMYNDTGWSADGWADRIDKIWDFLRIRGVTLYKTKSEGMINLVKRKKGWPMPASNMQFCTSELKRKPALTLYNKIDPDANLIVVTGRRREESQNRASLSLWEYESEHHGGRDIYNPLINISETERNDLVTQFGFDVLQHKSRECYPCVCSNKADLGKMDQMESRALLIEQVEIELGHTRNGKPRTMFRPYRVGGGVGIKQAIEWGKGGRGYKSKEVPEEYKEKIDGDRSVCETDGAYEITENMSQCSGGFCGN